MHETGPARVPGGEARRPGTPSPLPSLHSYAKLTSRPVTGTRKDHSGEGTRRFHLIRGVQEAPDDQAEEDAWRRQPRTAGREIKEIISMCEFPYAEVPFEKVINRPIPSCLRGILARRRGSLRRVYVFL